MVLDLEPDKCAVGEKVYVMGRRHEVKEGTGYLEALI
jgi:hypothetical protein